VGAVLRIAQQRTVLGDIGEAVEALRLDVGGTLVAIAGLVQLGGAREPEFCAAGNYIVGAVLRIAQQRTVLGNRAELIKGLLVDSTDVLPVVAGVVQCLATVEPEPRAAGDDVNGVLPVNPNEVLILGRKTVVSNHVLEGSYITPATCVSDMARVLDPAAIVQRIHVLRSDFVAISIYFLIMQVGLSRFSRITRVSDQLATLDVSGIRRKFGEVQVARATSVGMVNNDVIPCTVVASGTVRGVAAAESAQVSRSCGIHLRPHVSAEIDGRMLIRCVVATLTAVVPCAPDVIRSLQRDPVGGLFSPCITRAHHHERCDCHQCDEQARHCSPPLLLWSRHKLYLSPDSGSSRSPSVCCPHFSPA
jgi:hypothetical protein